MEAGWPGVEAGWPEAERKPEGLEPLEGRLLEWRGYLSDQHTKNALHQYCRAFLLQFIFANHCECNHKSLTF